MSESLICALFWQKTSALLRNSISEFPTLRNVFSKDPNQNKIRRRRFVGTRNMVKVPSGANVFGKDPNQNKIRRREMFVGIW